jgi:glycosyltransferase involved in cell wall biosynthesis
MGAQMKQYYVVHMTSVHDASDVRIFQKECRSLAENGYRVSLIVPHCRSGTMDGVEIHVVPEPKSRFDRMTCTAWKVYRKAIEQDADLYHFHDPELIPAGLLLKFVGKKVIYDAHELYALKILRKPWIPLPFRYLASQVLSLCEHISSRFFDHVVTADRFTANTFHSERVSVVANYPFLQPIQEHSERTAAARVGIYVGELTSDRGLNVMLEVARRLQSTGFELRLLGWFERPEDEQLVCAEPNVRYLGRQSHQTVLRELAKADLGLVLFQPVPCYYHAGENTVKLFEYMSRGLPVVVSNFPNLKRIVESANCGLCVDAQDAKQTADTISELLDNPRLLRSLGENGRTAVLREYNWEHESRTLLRIYREILGTTSQDLTEKTSIASV